MIGSFKRLAPPRRGRPCKELFVDLEVFLEIEGVAGGPSLVPRETREIFSPVPSRVFFHHGTSFRLATRLRPGGANLHATNPHANQSFPIHQPQQTAKKRALDCPPVPAWPPAVGFANAR